MTVTTPTKRKINIPISESLSPRQKKAFVALVENGGKLKPESEGKILRDSGYSEAIVKNPQKVTKSKAFIKILDKAGVTDKALAEAHNDLMNAAKIEFLDFPALKATRTVTVDGNGKKLKKPEKETVYRHTPDEVIKMQVESVPGVKLMYIQKGSHEKRAYIKVPENPVRKGAIEMGYKVKDHFAADKMEIVEPELTQEEMQALTGLFETQK